MIPNPILKVLLTLGCHGVRHLLMGGQACVFYGGAEFSRDCDVVILASDDNLARLSAAMEDLQAERIAIPALRAELLERGHAVHFRCHRADVKNLRLDVMTKMRGCDDFEQLWQRRTTIDDPEANFTYHLLSIEDLVKAKKTQRDKDWPMIRRLLEAHFVQFRDDPTPERVVFWLRELRTPTLLSDVMKSVPAIPAEVVNVRSWLTSVAPDDLHILQQLLDEEERRERWLDAEYWQPLKKELEQMGERRSRP